MWSLLVAAQACGLATRALALRYPEVFAVVAPALATLLTEAPLEGAFACIGGAGCGQAQRFPRSNTMGCRAMMAMTQHDVCVPVVTQALWKKSKELPGAGGFPRMVVELMGILLERACAGRRVKTAMVVNGFQ